MVQVSESSRTRQRHPALDRLETKLAAIVHGTAAAGIDVPNRDGGLLVLPTAIWLPGPADHAKAHRGLLPYPVVWDVPHVTVLEPESRHRVRWTASAWGHKATGELDVICSRIAPTSCCVTDLCRLDEVPERVWVGVGSARRLWWLLDDLGEQASEAKWSLHADLAPWLRQSLDSAHRAVSADMKVRRCIDDTTFEDLLSEIELGTAESSGLIERVVSRLTDTEKCRPSVDSARYIVTSFRRDAELALRRRLDDPRWVGQAFRNFARQHSHLAGRELVAAFNDSGCLAERIGMARAIRALQPAVAPEHVELDVERTSVPARPDDLPDIRHVVKALRRTYEPHGGLTGAARTVSRRAGGHRHEALDALANAVGTRRRLTALADMDEGAAISWLANRLVERGAA